MRQVLRHVALATGALAAVVLVVGTVWAVSRPSHDRILSAREVQLVTTQMTTTTAPPTTTLPPPPPREKDPEWAVLPELGGRTLGPGSSGDDVLAFEQRLSDVRFDPGPVDGKYDQATVAAVQGVQKLYNAEKISGRIDEATRFALMFFKWPEPMQADGEPTRVEIDIARQVMILWRDAKVQLITPVSSGSGEHYCYVDAVRNPGVRVCQYADTYSGRFEFGRRVNGWDRSPLGQLYNPVYFDGGIAVHGYTSVPTKPASHGCVRIPMYVSEYFQDLVDTGEPVYVFNGMDQNRGTTYTRVAGAAPAPEAPPPPDVAVAPNTTTAAPTTSDPGTTTTTNPTPTP